MRRVRLAVVLLSALALSAALVAQEKKPAAAAAPAEKTVTQLISEGQFQAAIDKGLPTVEAGTADLGMYLNLGTAYLNLKDYAKAQEMYERASVLDPASTLPYVDLAAVFDAQGLEDKAMEALSKAAVLDPAEGEKLFNYAYDKGSAYYEKQDYPKAEPLMRKAAEMKPEDFPANLGLAQCLEFQKKYADAVPFFQKAVTLLPADDIKRPALMIKVAKCQYFGKLYAEAVASAEKLLELRPNDEQALMFRAASYVALNDCAKAVPAVESFLAISKNDNTRMPLMKAMAKCQYDQKKYKDAVASYEKVLALNGSDEDALLNAGNSYLQLKNNPKALACFKKLAAVAKDPTLKANAQKNVKSLGG